MSRCLVAIDFGTGAVRSVVFDTRGKQLGAAYREISYDTLSGYPGACEFDGARMWRLIGRVVRKSLAEAGVRDGDVLAVASTSQRHGMALIGKRGETLYAGPNRDSRGRSVAGNEPVDEVYRLNGDWPMPIIVPYRLRWFERHQPEILERAMAMVMPNDWVTYQLCGEAHVSDSSGVES